MAVPPILPDIEIEKAWITAFGTIAAAFIVAVVGTIGAALVTRRFSRERDRQDRESQWRSHAIEITKLDAQRLMAASNSATDGPLEPFILTFLANYRDLTELGTRSPKDLYLKILADRIEVPDPAPSKVSAGIVACSGEAGDHPRIYLTVGAGETVRCPYCSKEFLGVGASPKP
jgi:zinc finger protein